MRRKLILLIQMIAIVQVFYAQDFEEEFYYTIDNADFVDTIRCVTCNITNETTATDVLSFTDDDLDSIDIDKAIFRRCYRRYGDFNLAFFCYEDYVNENVANNGITSFVFPQYFVKILHPSETFKLMIMSKNFPAEKICEFIRKHLIVYDASYFNKYVDRFVESLEEKKISCPYESLVVEWKALRSMLNDSQQSKSKQH